MTEEELYYRELRARLMSELEEGKELGDEEISSMIDELVLEAARRDGLSISRRCEISRELFYSVRKLDILQELIEDKSVTEIMVNGPGSVFVERNGKVEAVSRRFSSREKLEDVIQQIVGKCNRVVNARMPIVDARLDDGSRVNVVVEPVALNGPFLTIRKFPEKPIVMDTLVEYGSLTEEAAEFLESLVAAGYSMIIGGGTSAGKTTFLNALSNYIPKDERIITIEDNAELQIQGISNLVRMEAKMANSSENTQVTIRDLIKTALRMRPDRIIVGEVRSGEAVDMLQAFNTGHDGSLCTIHANSCFDMISRLETMVLMAFPLPIEAIRRQIASGVEVMIHLGRLRDHTRHVLEITEVTGMEKGEVTLNSLYKWDPGKGCLRKCGDLKADLKLEQTGWNLRKGCCN